MKIIKSFFVLTGLILTGFVLSAWISSIGIPEGSGLAGPAIVVGYGIFGAVVGLILGILLLVKTNKRIISIVAILGLAATLAVGFFLGLKIRETPKSVPPSPRVPVKPATNLQIQESMGLGRTAWLSIFDVDYVS